MFKGLLLLSGSLKQAFPVWSLITDYKITFIRYAQSQNIEKLNNLKWLGARKPKSAKIRNLYILITKAIIIAVIWITHTRIHIQFKGLLLLSSSLKQAFPVWSLITDNSFRIIAYVERKKDNHLGQNTQKNAHNMFNHTTQIKF
jgi:hypothetical protein